MLRLRQYTTDTNKTIAGELLFRWCCRGGGEDGRAPEKGFSLPLGGLPPQSYNDTRFSMNTLKFIALSTVLTSGIGLVGAQAAETRAHDHSHSRNPNILFIFSDDQMPQSIGAYGNGVVKTPNLDRLGSSGVQFNRAYNMGSFAPAVCVSSRTMLNTGGFGLECGPIFFQTDIQSRGAEHAPGWRNVYD